MSGDDFLGSVTDWEESALLFQLNGEERALIIAGTLRLCLIVPATDETGRLVYELSTEGGRTFDHGQVMRLARAAY